MVEQREDVGTAADQLRVLLVDNDEDVAEIVSAILSDEGYAVTTIDTVEHETIARTVGQLEPDCMLLDGADGVDFGRSWTEAAYLAKRSRSVPVVMFTAHAPAAEEATDGTSDRARAAEFAAILTKPFSLDELLSAVETATGKSQRFDRSMKADSARTRQLVAELEAAGATDVRTSERREWATFARPEDGRLYQLYWWQKLGAYIVGVYDDEARLNRVGHYHERRDAIAAALRSPASTTS